MFPERIIAVWSFGFGGEKGEGKAGGQGGKGMTGKGNPCVFIRVLQGSLCFKDLA